MSQLREGRRRRRLGRPVSQTLLALYDGTTMTISSSGKIENCLGEETMQKTPQFMYVPIIRKTGFPFSADGFNAGFALEFGVVDETPPAVTDGTEVEGEG